MPVGFPSFFCPERSTSLKLVVEMLKCEPLVDDHPCKSSSMTSRSLFQGVPGVVRKDLSHSWSVLSSCASLKTL